MGQRILILTQPEDLHACSVWIALRRKGASPTLWQTTDFPTQGFETVRFRGGGASLAIAGADLQLDGTGFDSVWNRRAGHALDETVLHPADLEFAELQCRLFRRSFFEILAPRAFWVNPDRSVRRIGKLLQQSAAAQVGLATPDALFTNDPFEIRCFLREHGGRAVYKTFSSRPWKDGETFWMPYTSLVTEEALVDDEILRRAPGIYQAVVPKAFELRVVVMGRHAVAAKIMSQETERGRVDWRRASGEVEIVSFAVPGEIAQLCSDLLRRLGLVFGSFDFVVTPEGEHVFLEVNQAGQFLFVEHFTGQPVLDAFCEFLLAASPDFQWAGERGVVRYQEIQKEALFLSEEIRQAHVRPGESVWTE